MGFLIRRAMIRLAFGGAGLFDWRRAMAPQPARVSACRRRPPAV